MMSECAASDLVACVMLKLRCLDFAGNVWAWREVRLQSMSSQREHEKLQLKTIKKSVSHSVAGIVAMGGFWCLGLL